MTHTGPRARHPSLPSAEARTREGRRRHAGTWIAAFVQRPECADEMRDDGPFNLFCNLTLLYHHPPTRGTSQQHDFVFEYYRYRTAVIGVKFELCLCRQLSVSHTPLITPLQMTQRTRSRRCARTHLRVPALARGRRSKRPPSTARMQ